MSNESTDRGFDTREIRETTGKVRLNVDASRAFRARNISRPRYRKADAATIVAKTIKRSCPLRKLGLVDTPRFSSLFLSYFDHARCLRIQPSPLTFVPHFFTILQTNSPFQAAGCVKQWMCGYRKD